MQNEGWARRAIEGSLTNRGGLHQDDLGGGGKKEIEKEKEKKEQTSATACRGERGEHKRKGKKKWDGIPDKNREGEGGKQRNIENGD